MTTLTRRIVSLLTPRGRDVSSNAETSPVWSCNEWDSLEEVVVGVVDGAMVPQGDAAVDAIIPEHAEWFIKKYGGKPFPEEMIEKAGEELDGLAKVMTDLGITVKRPQPFDFSKKYTTPWWSSRGLYAAMPRDVFMVFGDTIIEAPMAWRSRYFEGFAFHDLMNDYFKRGGRWLVAPKSTMDEEFYDKNYDSRVPMKDNKKQFVLANNEIAFDAADFVRCGKDVFVQKSNVTNDMGIEWVRRHVDPEFKIHEVEFGDLHPMHIDTTIVPLAPGKILVNPEWVKKLPPIFDSWEVLTPPPPVISEDTGLYFSSDWLTLNMLSIDEKRIIVEEQETPLIEALKKWGFEPIPIPFRNFYPFGGSVHCATLDVRRKGRLESYF
ncbi:amidinotransferase [Candidatus Parcubacteria bacterium]|nr:amidinotransferase [Candidatus Parcubacteria bacterium]